MLVECVDIEPHYVSYLRLVVEKGASGHSELDIFLHSRRRMRRPLGGELYICKETAGGRIGGKERFLQ